MIVRWSIALAAALGLLAIAIGVILWLVCANSAERESVRHSRVVHQQLKQQLMVLQSTDHAPLVSRLNQSLDALRLSLVEVVSQPPLPTGVNEVGFEQQILPPMLDEGKPYPVTALRLLLTMSVAHSGGVLNLLNRVAQEASVWPVEVRGCELYRLVDRDLKAQCVVDVYHWIDDTVAVDLP